MLPLHGLLGQLRQELVEALLDGDAVPGELVIWREAGWYHQGAVLFRQSRSENAGSSMVGQGAAAAAAAA